MGSDEDENIMEFVKNVDAASEGIKPFSNATEDPPHVSPPLRLLPLIHHLHHCPLRPPFHHHLTSRVQTSLTSTSLRADTDVRMSGWDSGPFGPLKF